MFVRKGVIVYNEWTAVYLCMTTGAKSTECSHMFHFPFPRLIAVGEEFCGSTSEDLHDSIRTQTVKYFKTYHRSRMDELRMFLENDAWELCPVKASFKIVDLSVSK